MIETSAHLVDRVIPQVSVRQCVLSFLWSLRLFFARQPEVLSKCLTFITRALETDRIHRAGLSRKDGAQGGVVTLIQRFGASSPKPAELKALLDRIIKCGIRRLERDGLLIAAVACQHYQPERLERLCRYVTRRRVCLERLTIRDDAKILYNLKNPYRNGTTHVLFPGSVKN
jgi:hypothetical protein